jgi:hypothetical protein
MNKLSCSLVLHGIVLVPWTGNSVLSIQLRDTEDVSDVVTVAMTFTFLFGSLVSVAECDRLNFHCLP